MQMGITIKTSETMEKRLTEAQYRAVLKFEQALKEMEEARVYIVRKNEDDSLQFFNGNDVEQFIGYDERDSYPEAVDITDYADDSVELDAIVKHAYYPQYSNERVLAILKTKRLPQVTEPEAMEFYSIEPDGKGGKQIHMLGYIYQNDDHWTGVEPAFLILPLREFIDQLKKEEDYTDRLLSEAKLYEGDYDDEGAVDYINHYFCGHTANRRLHYSEITIDTPCGDYIA